MKKFEKKIKFIYTGGTIGGLINKDGVIDKDLSTKKFIKELIKKVKFPKNIEVNYISSPVKELSENISYDDWIKILKEIDLALQEDFIGIIILHGTDTMCFTASICSLFLKNANIPIIFTGANFPLTSVYTDGIENLEYSIYAINKLHKMNSSGIYIGFKGGQNEKFSLHLATKAKKVKTEGHAYESIGTSAIVEIKKILGKKIFFIKNKHIYEYINGLEKKCIQISEFNIEKKIAYVKFFPGEFWFDETKILSEAKAIVIEVFGGGTAATKGAYSILPFLKKAKEKMIPVFVTSSSISDIKMVTYETSIEMVENGAIPTGKMFSEIVYTKLMVVLGNFNKYDDIKDEMLKDYYGETK